MLEQNASLGEYYEQVCPEFLESMPPEVRAHVYDTNDTTMPRHRECDADGACGPPGKQSAIGIASPGGSGEAWSVARAGLGTLILVGIGILTLLAVAWLILQRVRNRKE